MNSSTLNNSNLFEKMLGDFITTNLFNIIIAFLFLILIWLLIRDARTWYWKTTKIVSLLEDIKEDIHSLVNVNKDETKEEIKKVLSGFIKKKIDSEKVNQLNIKEQSLPETDNEN